MDAGNARDRRRIAVVFELLRLKPIAPHEADAIGSAAPKLRARGEFKTQPEVVFGRVLVAGAAPRAG